MSSIPNYKGPLNPKSPVPDGESKISIYGYTPSLALPVVALVLFGSVLAVTSYYLLRKKGSRTFQGLLAFGTVMELVGYAFRTASHFNTYVVTSFVVQYFMIVCAPILYSAAIYFALSLLAAHHQAEAVLPISAKLTIGIFVTLDVVTIGTQIAGAALIGVSESAIGRGDTPPLQPETANHILLAGLAVQCASFLIFIILLAFTLLRNRKATRSQRPAMPQTYLYVLMCCSDLVFLRTLFRLGETAEGLFAFASTHESLFGVFEFAPVIAALGIFTIYPIHRYIQRSDSSIALSSPARNVKQTTKTAKV